MSAIKNILALSLSIFITLSRFFFVSHSSLSFSFSFYPLSIGTRPRMMIRSTAKVEKERQKDVHPTRHRRCVCKETNLRAPNHSLCISVQDKILYNKNKLSVSRVCATWYSNRIYSSLREISDFTFAIVAALDDIRERQENVHRNM